MVAAGFAELSGGGVSPVAGAGLGDAFPAAGVELLGPGFQPEKSGSTQAAPLPPLWEMLRAPAGARSCRSPPAAEPNSCRSCRNPARRPMVCSREGPANRIPDSSNANIQSLRLVRAPARSKCTFPHRHGGALPHRPAGNPDCSNSDVHASRSSNSPSFEEQARLSPKNEGPLMYCSCSDTGVDVREDGGLCDCMPAAEP